MCLFGRLFIAQLTGLNFDNFRKAVLYEYAKNLYIPDRKSATFVLFVFLCSSEQMYTIQYGKNFTGNGY
jgi:hypothetical protein